MSTTGNKPRRQIPIQTASSAPAASGPSAACAAGEPFALMVLGDSMEPEFVEGDIILVEPEGLATEGSFVLAELGGELIFRQLVKTREGWRLEALNPAYRGAAIQDVREVVKGVIIQKSKPGRRKLTKRYVE